MKKEDRDNGVGEVYAGEDYPAVEGEGSKKGGSVLLGIALYAGVFLVLAVAVGGYYYLNYTRGSLNRSIPGNPSGLIGAIDIGGGEKTSTSREAPFIEGQPGAAVQTSGLSLDERAREASPAGARAVTQAAPETPSAGRVPSPSGTIPLPVEETGRESVASKPPVSPDPPETLLSHLVLRDDNPFREKFLKRFQDAQAPKMSLKGVGRSTRSGRALRSSRSGGAERTASGLVGGELPILPDIADGGDRPGDLRVVGVIQTREASIALTNKGELKVGSLVDGDAVTAITINEVRLASGRTLKVTAQ
jgi:hypothetical protein